MHPPYVLLFDSQFVEVRHLEDGHLAQIIQAADVRCVWDGRGNDSIRPLSPGSDGWSNILASGCRIHVVAAETVAATSPYSRSPSQVVYEVCTIENRGYVESPFTRSTPSSAQQYEDYSDSEFDSPRHPAVSPM